MTEFITRGLNIKVDPYRVYQTYIALKNHFNTDYDFFKYKGNTKTSFLSFERRNDKLFFNILSSKYTHKETIEIFVSNTILNREFWVGDIISQETITIWKNWKGKIQNFNYWFSVDCDKIFMVPLEKLLSCPNNGYPVLLKLVLQHEILLETLIVLNEMIPFMERWNTKLVDDPLWCEFYKRVTKYKPFLGNIDKKKYANIIKKVLTNSIQFDSINTKKLNKLLDNL
jgi:hypothetical protein